MSQSSGAEVNASIFATDPGTAYQSWADGHEPRVGVVVAGSSLAAEIRISKVAYISPERHGGASRLSHASLEKLLHEEGTLVRYHLF